MNTAYYLTSLEFEILVRSQNENEIFLPCDGKIEQAEDNDLIYAMHSMVEAGVLEASPDGEGFDITSGFEPIVRCILGAEKILEAISPVRGISVYYYINGKQAASIEPVINRADAYKIGITGSDDFVEELSNAMELPEPRDGLPADAQAVTHTAEDEETEKAMLGVTVQTPVQELMNNGKVACVLDLWNAGSGEKTTRYVIYKLSVLEKVAVINRSASAQTEYFGSGWPQANLSRILEG